MPKIIGIFNRLSSTATFCTARIFSTVLILNKPPTLPSFIFFPTSELEAWPVTISPDPGRFNCPIFSSSVIFFINTSMNAFIFASPVCAFPFIATNNKNIIISLCIIFMLCGFIISKNYFLNLSKLGCIILCQMA